MTNFSSYGNTQQAYQQPYQVTQYFPQPQGSIYMINSSNDVNNVPVGAGISAAICLKENALYLKTIQNGSPMLLGYRLCPLEDSNNSTLNQPQNKTPESDFDKRVSAALEDYGKRLEKIENHLNNKAKQGGTGEWQF